MSRASPLTEAGGRNPGGYSLGGWVRSRGLKLQGCHPAHFSVSWSTHEHLRIANPPPPPPPPPLPPPPPSACRTRSTCRAISTESSSMRATGPRGWALWMYLGWGGVGWVGWVGGGWVQGAGRVG